MKFQLDKEARETLDRILEKDALSQEASSLLSDFLDNAYDAIDIKRLQKLHKELSCSLEDAYYPAFLSVLDIDPQDEELQKIEKETNIRSMRLLDAERFLADPYRKNIRFHEKSSGKWRLTTNYYLPYEAFLYDETKAKREDLFLPKDSLGYFKEKVDYPLVEENDHVWMSVTPYEIATMSKPIEESTGRVLALGLGLGYFPYMVLRKKEVKEVVVVEKDKAVIDLFRKEILPQFQRKDIRILQEDALSYLEKPEASQFDSLFFDIHSTPEDALSSYPLFLRFRKDHPNTKAFFWIEQSTLVYLRRLLLTLVREEWDSLYQESKEGSLSDRIIDHFHKRLEERTLQTKEDVLSLLDDESLQELLLDFHG